MSVSDTEADRRILHISNDIAAVNGLESPPLGGVVAVAPMIDIVTADNGIGVDIEYVGCTRCAGGLDSIALTCRLNLHFKFIGIAIAFPGYDVVGGSAVRYA